jgi:DNA-binding NarL/FixJ family response regulator
MRNNVMVSRILLVDDHDLFRAGLKELVSNQPEFEVVGEARDGLEALKLARDLQPDLIVMDIQMPICDGLEATRLICTQLPGSKIIMLTVREEDENLFAAIKAGAVGYLLKNTDKTSFFSGMRTVLAGDVALPPALAASMLNEFSRLMNKPAKDAAAEDIPDLTPREFNVLEHASTGATDKEIAAILSISIYTVKSHMRSVLEKLQVSNRREAARLAEEYGLLRNKKNKL